MSEVDTIVCRPTKWFYLRAGAMALMFGVFLVLFLKDWKIGWPKKNEAYYTYEAFEEAEKAFDEHLAANKSAAEWESFSGNQKIGFPDEEGILPSGVDADAPWPEELANYAGYKKAHEEEGQKLIPPLWASYTDRISELIRRQGGERTSSPVSSFPQKLTAYNPINSNCSKRSAPGA